MVCQLDLSRSLLCLSIRFFHLIVNHGAGSHKDPTARKSFCQVPGKFALSTAASACNKDDSSQCAFSTDGSNDSVFGRSRQKEQRKRRAKKIPGT